MQGAIGPTGPIGNKGELQDGPGPKGNIGPTGPNSAPGASGPIGPIGAISPDTPRQGAKGNPGTTPGSYPGISTAVSLKMISNGAGETTNMEWQNGIMDAYNQVYTNFQYVDMDGTNDYITAVMNGSYDNLTSFDWSIRVWLRQDQTSGANRMIWDFNAGTSNSNNRMFLQYNSGLNRFIARMRTNSTNFDRQWGLHDNNSATGTGTNSSTKWTSSNRGNVNSDNMCMLTLTYDASQASATNAFKIYWNASELTSQAVANSNARTNNALPNLAIGAQRHALTNSPWNGTQDEWAFYNKVLSSGEVSTLYNSGARAKAAQELVTSNLIENCSFDFGGGANLTTKNGNLTSGVLSGVSIVTY